MVDPYSIALAVVSAFVYSIVFYVKKRQSKDGEEFDIRKLAATVIVGVVVGVAAALSGSGVTRMSVFEQLAAYSGIIALVESLLKTILRRARKRYNSG